MEKPITLIISETREAIVSIINQSKLPPFLLDSLFRDFYSELHAMSVQQEERDRADYENALKNKGSGNFAESITAGNE